jgi:hypothetical protein
MTKKKCLFKDLIYGEVVTFSSKKCIYKIHDVEFENVTIEYLSVQEVSIVPLSFYEQSWLIEAINKFIMENYKVI